MPGKPTSGNRTAQRGKPTRLRYRLTKEAALKLKLLAWQYYGRPATDEEEDQFLNRLIHNTPITERVKA
jgi:hypothetical protein